MQDTTPRYKHYLLSVLLVTLAFNFVDRLALGIVLQDLKTDLALSDTQLGYLSGIAFALFYSVMGLPIARWADRGNRITIITLTVAIWSAAVALCGVARSFVTLLLIRIGVGVGEAGCIPPAHSLIADYFSRAERPKAAAIYALGGPLAFGVGYFAAGWLNEFYGWRTTFVLIGAPGLLLAALAGFTLKEPRRKREVSAATNATAAPRLGEVCKTLWSSAPFRHLLFGFSVLHFFGYGILQWQPTFFVRSFGFQTGVLGTWFAVIYGIGGLIGTYLGGAWASHRAAHNERLQLRTVATVYVGLCAISVLIYLAPTAYAAFGLLIVYALGFYSTSGPLLGTVQTLVPERMRATALAVVYLFANLIGMGLGPLAVGALSDLLEPSAAKESLRYALLAMSPGFLWVASHMWLASRTVTHEIDVAQKICAGEVAKGDSLGAAI